MISTICYRLYSRCSPLAITLHIIVALLTLRVRERLRGLLVRAQLSWPHNQMLWMSLACLLVVTINEMSGAPVHLSPLSSNDLTYLSLAGLHNYLFWAGWKVLKMQYRLEFVNPNLLAIYPIRIKGWQTISSAREDIWYCLKVLMSLAVIFRSKIAKLLLEF